MDALVTLYTRSRSLWGTSPADTSLIRQQDVEQWDKAIQELKSSGGLDPREYGTVDLTGATASTSAMAAVFADAATYGKPVIALPGTILTDTIDYKLQQTAGFGHETSTIMGLPGKDVFHLNSSLSFSSVTSGSIEKLTIVVDDSTDASSSFNTGAYKRGGTVGNAGIAVDHPDGAAIPGRLFNFLLRDVRIKSTSMTASGQNKTAGVYAQAPIQQSSVQNVFFYRLVHGWWDDYPAVNLTSVEHVGDHNQYLKMFFNGCSKAARFVNPEYCSFSNLGFQSNPTALELKSVTSLVGSFPSHCWLDTVMIEDATTSPWNVTGYDISGSNIAIIPPSAQVVHAANSGTWTDFQVPNQSGGQELNITGGLNKFVGVVTTGAGLVTDTAGNNYVEIGRYRGAVLAGRVVEAGLPSCRVYNSAAISVASGATTALTFNSERWDTGGLHSTSTNTSRLTCALPGKYLIEGNAYFAGGAGTYRRLSIGLNGGTTLAMQGQQQQAGNGISELQVSTVYDLAPGDYVELFAWQDSGGALNVNAQANYSPEFGMTKIV